jgi:glycosyltransferase involved in cell wall biosynthesis
MRCTDWLGHLTTTNSHIVAARLVERHVVPARRLHVIPNGLPIEQYRVNAVVRTRLRQELAVDEQTFLWLAAGRLAHRKDYPTLLQAMRYLVDQHPRSQLRIAGKGELRAALERQVDDLRLRGYVRFTGERDDLPCLLQAADALVLSSIWEGLPNIVMEALATGIPVVATDVGGIQEIVTDNESALLVPARAPEALAAAMRRLVEMPTDARARIGRHGQRHIADHFGLASVLDQWDALFHAQLGVANIHPVEDER